MRTREILFAANMEQPLELHVGPMGFFRRIERTKPKLFPLRGYLRCPSAALARHAQQTCLAVRLSPLYVLSIQLVGCFTEIIETVVGSVPISVVELARGPRPMDVKPCKSVGEKKGAVDADDAVAILPDAPRLTPHSRTTRGGDPPREYTGDLVVIDKSTEPRNIEFLRIYVNPSGVWGLYRKSLTLAFNSSIS